MATQTDYVHCSICGDKGSINEMHENLGVFVCDCCYEEVMQQMAEDEALLEKMEEKDHE